MGKDQEEEGCEKGVQLVCYYIPFEILTRYPYGTNDVKDKYHYKVVVSSAGLDNYYDIVSLSRKIGERVESARDGVDLRLVCEVIENGKNVVTFCFEDYGDSVLINGKVFAQCEETKQLYNIVKKYLPGNRVRVPALVNPDF